MCAKEYLYTLPLHVVNPNPNPELERNPERNLEPKPKTKPKPNPNPNPARISSRNGTSGWLKAQHLGQLEVSFATTIAQSSWTLSGATCGATSQMVSPRMAQKSLGHA